MRALDFLPCSLSDLCNFAGVDYESENDSDEWQSTSRRTASLSSDVSALSYVSVMPSEELDKLLEDVRGLGDDNLQVHTGTRNISQALLWFFNKSFSGCSCTCHFSGPSFNWL